MPSSATITSFFNFTANTKARAAQVNNNFDVLRGHIIPIHPNTATSAHNTYDLGSTEYYWSTLYTRRLDILSNTSTGNELRIYGGTAGSNPELFYSVAGTSTAYGKHSFYVAGTLTAQIDENGFNGAYLKANSVSLGKRQATGLTTSAAEGYVAQGAAFSTSHFTIGSSDTLISGSTCTIVSSGRPIFIGIGPGANGQCYGQVTGSTSTSIEIQASINVFYDQHTTTSRAIQIPVAYEMYGFTAGVINATALDTKMRANISAFTIVALTAGTHNFFASSVITSTSTAGTVTANFVGRIYAYEL